MNKRRRLLVPSAPEKSKLMGGKFQMKGFERDQIFKWIVFPNSSWEQNLSKT